MLKPTCPLLAHPCIENRCAWWSSEHATCVSVGIFNEMASRRMQESAFQPTKVKSVKKGQ